MANKPECASASCIHDATSIGCEGTCGKSFHVICAGLTAPDLQVLTSSPNIVWMCDACRDAFLADHGKPPAEPSIYSDNPVDQLRSRGVKMAKLTSGSSRNPSKCASPTCVFSDLTIICERSCAKAFHVMCIGLLDVDLQVISSSDNIMWFCDGCRNSDRKGPSGIEKQPSDT